MSRVPRGGIRDRTHAREVEQWLKDHPGHPDHAAVVHEWVAFDWRDRNLDPASDHLAREVEAAHRRGHPLDPGGEPVPGCPCGICTGVPDCTEAVEAHRREMARERYGDLEPLPVEAARAVPILDVATMLGIEHRRGWGLCPFHADSSPSLHFNAKKNAAFCNPCGQRWDGIALVMELRGLEFPEAVKTLVT